MGSSLNQHAAELSLCNTLVLLLDLAFKQSAQDPKNRTSLIAVPAYGWAVQTSTMDARPGPGCPFRGVGLGMAPAYLFRGYGGPRP